MHSPIWIKREDNALEFTNDLAHAGTAIPIQYDADSARVRVLQMIDELAGTINMLGALWSNLRKDEFRQTIACLRAQAETPSKTLIAFCGPTGAGKSTLLNALLGLGENIVPTSAIQACTAVVTEVAYRSEQGFEAEIEYLTAAEWKEEISVLLGDIRDPMNSKNTDEVAVARAKVGVVYPSVPMETLVNITADELMVRNSALSIILGNTLRIVETNPARFSQELSRYLEPESQEGLLDSATNAVAGGTSPAYWPLIRHVRIYGFMARADRFFIVAPITRAVSDKVAMDLCGKAFKSQLMMDGKYHVDAITFVATKCDDVPCEEIIRNLHLKRDSVLQAIRSRIEEAQDSLRKWKQTKAKFESDLLDLEQRLESGTACKQEPRATESASRIPAALDDDIQRPWAAEMLATCDFDRLRVSKRPRQPEEEQHSKKQRVNLFANFGVLAPRVESPHGTRQAQNQAQPYPIKPRTRPQDDEDAFLAVTRKLRSANMSITIVKNKLRDATSELTAFCSAKRSQWATSKLQAHFRAGLEEMEVDDIVNDYSTPDQVDGDLAVFTVSSRTQLQVEGPAEKSGERAPGSIDTGIPELRRWIDVITRPARDKASERLLLQMRAFICRVETCIDGIPGVSLADCEALEAQWRSKSKRSPLDAEDEDEDLSYREVLEQRYRSSPDTAIIPTLLKAFWEIIDDLVDDVSTRFGKELGLKCHLSASDAASDLINASEDFTANLHHNTYRATLRRKGVYKENLNALLAVPFTRRIASTWSDVFADDMLKTLEQRAAISIVHVLEQVIDSTPDYIRNSAREAMRSTVQSSRDNLHGVQAPVRQALDTFKTDLGLSLSPLVQRQLQKGYEDALLEVGRGSYNRQKAVFNSYLESKKQTLFVDTAAALKRQLEGAADVVGDTLDKELEKVARKVEVDISILWEKCPLEGEEDNKARVATKTLLKDTAEEIDRWLDAKKVYDAARTGATL